MPLEQRNGSSVAVLMKNTRSQTTQPRKYTIRWKSMNWIWKKLSVNHFRRSVTTTSNTTTPDRRQRNSYEVIQAIFRDVLPIYPQRQIHIHLSAIDVKLKPTEPSHITQKEREENQPRQSYIWLKPKTKYPSACRHTDSWTKNSGKLKSIRLSKNVIHH